ncbi:Rieske 2Fe-2S domain-containing protein [Emcibacter nanhaiensis]|uniref:Rieske 2Fe-2S domain-containing protein n=1 Tax=Emcibacter nanhaiensis TaxID=1505037 RepID=A0A501PIY1_9PROT|nr:Rieske 2Fe-2S domain-containing protein [Emcibacter nanhaiensis]TPD60175.1 Rieske 2Fe-2S domain-containing protein [Emcibacter nanhaiensis]
MNEVKPVRRRSGEGGKHGISEARKNDARTQSQYQPYKDAEWGFVNHWYPALFSEELKEEEVEGITICGIPIVLRRVDGKVYALKDQCIHRGVRLSSKPMCLTKNTISCWYHGFTFNLDDGDLSTIVGNPDDKLIGTTGITSYPVEEVGGMIFVFVREDDYPLEDVPPLSEDLPIRFPESSEEFPHPLWPASPSLLDDNAVCLGMHRTGEANWRIACENGFDNAHILVHKDNSIIHAKDWVLPLGIRPASDDCITTMEEEDKPKGLMQWLFTDRWEPILENKKVDLKVEGLNSRFYRTSVVLPGVLMVENWPEEHVVQLEWYVPITDDTYEYWEVLVKVCNTEEERKAFQYRFDVFYKPLCLEGFNDCDLYAREAMQDFYADGTGWDDEQLVDTDVSPITWRKVASRHNRGIAKPGRGVDGSVKASSIRMRRLAEGKKLGYFVEKIEE